MKIERVTPLLLLIDGNNLVHRAFHAIGSLSVRSTGEMVNAVYGFASMLLKVVSEYRPTHIAVAFDKKGPTFRHEMFSDYKANRQATPETLIAQLARARQMVLDFNLALYELDGFEADDILGSLARQASSQGMETIVFSGDADVMQLVSKHVKVLSPRTTGEAMLFDEVGVSEKYGVPPELVVDLKALKGDASDNIPGVRGIGEKTAVKLLNQYGSLSGIYSHLDQVVPLRVRELLQQDESNAKLSRVLASIDTDSPVKLDYELSKISNFNYERAVYLFRELEFFKLTERLSVFSGTNTSHQQQVLSFASLHPCSVMPEPVKRKHEIVRTASDLEQLAKSLKTKSEIAMEVIAEGDHPISAQLVGVAFSPNSGEAYYIPLTHAGLEDGPQLPLEHFGIALADLFASGHITFCMHNANFALTVLRQVGIQAPVNVFDIMLAAHLLCEQALDINSLSLRWLNIALEPFPPVTGAKRIPLNQYAVKQVADIACSRSGTVALLRPLLIEEMRKQDLLELFEKVETPLVFLLIAMQCHGVMIDTYALNSMAHRIREEILALELQIFSYAGCSFNINSPRQLGEILFEKLKLPTTQRKKKSWTTDSAVLEELCSEHKIADCVLRYRQLGKLLSTYVEVLPRLVNPKSRRVHTVFNQTRTSTGRLSSSDPNLQNIPVRGELGREIRQAIIAPQGSVLLSGDYSQIDLRALAHLSQDAVLVEAFRRGEDVHSATASQLYGVDVSAVTKDMRSIAKTVNFGVIYGMSGYGLEQATELSRSEANQFIEKYFGRFAGVASFLKMTKEQARRQGFVRTLLGRRRYIPDIDSSNRTFRESAERMAINMPVQGTSADIIKVAMLSIDAAISQKGLKSRLILQIHDELVFEVPLEELGIVKEMVTSLMESAVDLSVPLCVDIKIGTTLN